MEDPFTSSPLPSNADCEIQRIAVWALNERTKPGDHWHGWLPDPEHINALPQPLRDYIHDLETRADPAGDVAQIAFLKETVDALVIRVRELEQEISDRRA